MLGIWMWADSVLAAGADKVFDDCKLIGVTDVFYLTKGLSGRCAFPSEIAPCMEKGRDLLKEAIVAAHRRNIRLHAWFTSAQDASYCAEHPASGLFHFRSGHSDKTVSIADDTYCMYLLKLLGEMLHNYDVDGVHLDYLRYNHLLYGWSEADKLRYQHSGVNVEHVCELIECTFYATPENQLIFDQYRRGEADVLALADARIQTVNRFADALLTGLREQKPKICYSAALMPEGAYDSAFAHLHYGQCYRDLGKRFDLILPMAYSKAYGKDESWVKSVAQGARSFSPSVLLGLHAYEGSSGAALAKDIEAAGSIEGLRGICLFRYGACVLGKVANGKLILANPLSESITRIELTEGEQKQSLEIALPPQERLTLSHASDVCMLRAWAGEKEVCAYLAK